MKHVSNSRGQATASSFCLSALILTVIFFGVGSNVWADWPQFRSADNNPVATDANLPLHWNDRQNVAWKVDLPGRGPSSPIVVGGKVIVTCSSGVREDRLHVVCFDTADGRQLWQRQFWATGRTFCHSSMSNATPTPASDGNLVFAFYSSNDLVCIDTDGNFQWFRGLAHDYPKTGNDVGMSSSPIVVGDTVIVQIQNQGNSFAAGIDKATGQTRWRIPREPESMWASPALIETADGRKAVLMQSRKAATAVDPRDGKTIWEEKLSCATIASSVFAAGTVFVPAEGITALRVDAADDDSRLAWQSNQLRPTTPSPVVHDGRIYVVNGAGILICAGADDGKIYWKLRLKGPIWSTPVLANGYLYALSGKGLAQVVRIGPDRGEVVAENDFAETIQATAAVAGNAYYVRSDAHLWKIARDAGQ